MSDEIKRATISERERNAIRCLVQIRERSLWTREEAVKARAWLGDLFRTAPTLEELETRYGPETVATIAAEMIDERKAMQADSAERAAIGSPCHLCHSARAESDPDYHFGLAQILEESSAVPGALAMLALNVLTVPLGFVVGGSPGGSMRAHVLRCRLVLCQGCGRKRRRFFGGHRITRLDCEQHPSWQRLNAAGFTRFLGPDELTQLNSAS